MTEKKLKDRRENKTANPARTGGKRSLIRLIIGLALILLGVILIYDRISKTVGAPTISPPDYVSTSDNQDPDEKKPDMSQSYEVPADQPRRIIIPDLSVNGFIQQVGVTPEGYMATPNNIHLAGYYVDKETPGQEGLSIINGHVRGRYGEGIFYNLKNIKKGQKIKVEFGDKSVREFEVVGKKQVLEKGAAKVMLSKLDGVKAQLNLITCGGFFNGATRTYNERVIVFSKLIK